MRSHLRLISKAKKTSLFKTSLLRKLLEKLIEIIRDVRLWRRLPSRNFSYVAPWAQGSAGNFLRGVCGEFFCLPWTSPGLQGRGLPCRGPRVIQLLGA